MINVVVMIYDDVVPSSVTGVIDLITGANKYLEKNGKPTTFHLQLSGEKPANVYPTFLTQQISQKTFKETGVPQLIIVPAFSIGNETVVKKNQVAVQWLRDMKYQGAEVASLCVGSYFLAEAGLLDGKEVASHWAAADDIRKRYPRVKIKSDLLITDKEGVYTSGGAFSSLKLVVYLIEKFCGRETALWISKMFAVEMDRISQAHFAVFKGQHQHEDKEILQAQLYIENRYRDDIHIRDVASVVNMGNRNFIRRFKAATNNTPLEYLQRVRIESAKKAIETSEKDLSFIIDDTGYSDVKTFRTIFKRFTGLSPVEYKKKYARR